MTISQIYARYQTPRNLQQHMLRVASLASIILDGWQGVPIHKEDIVTCALLHDIAKPVTFDPEKQKQYFKSEGELNEVLQLIKNMQTKYGTDEHIAARAIFQEIGCNENVIRLIDNLEWPNLPRLLRENDLESLVLMYADMRIAPSGIVSLQDRLVELQTRAPFLGIDEVINHCSHLEATIQQHVFMPTGQTNNLELDQKVVKVNSSRKSYSD